MTFIFWHGGNNLASTLREYISYPATILPPRGISFMESDGSRNLKTKSGWIHVEVGNVIIIDDKKQYFRDLDYIKEYKK